MTKSEAEWHSLSAWSVIGFTVNNFRLLLTNAYAILPFVYTGWSRGFDSPWMIGAMVAILLIIFTASFVKWLKFRYRLQAEQLDIRSGLFFTRADEIPFNKIQNVRMQQPFYYRPFGLYSLVVETAGSKSDEASLAAVNYRQALWLKKRLLTKQSPNTDDDTLTHGSADSLNHQGTESSELSESAVNATVQTKPMWDIVKFGFYQNNLLWFAIIAGPVFSQLEWDKILELEAVDSSVNWYLNMTHGELGLQSLAVMIIIMLILGMFMAISVMSALLKYHPYKLSLQQDTLHRTGGIIAKQHDAMRLRRIQVIRYTQPLFGRWLKLWTIDFKQVKGHEVEKRGQHMLVPSMTDADISNLLPTLNGMASQSKQLPGDYQPIHSLWLWRRLSVAFPAIALIGYAGLSATQSWQIFAIIAGLGLLLTVSLILKYRQWGFYLNGNDLWIHSGNLGHKWHCVPLSKVQHVVIVQTPGQKRRNLANLKLGLASGTLQVPYISLEDARNIAEKTLSLIAKDKQNWI